MEIQSDLIILPPNNHLPLPWPVRGPLGLETGSEVSIALVHTGERADRLPDIIVSPLQSEYLNKTYTLDVELGERSGAVADFLAWLGDSIRNKTGNQVNIVLSETITLEGRNKHKMHLVLEPALGSALEKNQIESVINEISINENKDVVWYKIDKIYPSYDLVPFFQQQLRVEGGWLKYDGWVRRILKSYPKAGNEYDIGRVVVSSNPQQRLLRFIVPKKGVIDLRVPHNNRPGALRAISDVIRKSGYNILSSRLSRTPPLGFSTRTSVFVAACEPLENSMAEADLIAALENVNPVYMIENIDVSTGKYAEKSLFLMPLRTEKVTVDPEVSMHRDKIRRKAFHEYKSKYEKKPSGYVFISKRFITREVSEECYLEQERAVKTIIAGIESAGHAAIEAGDPGINGGKEDEYVRSAVFGRLWAGDACIVLALDEKSEGTISPSMAHEVGFFSGRGRPVKIFVSRSRDRDSVFGNIVGKNRIVYPDGEAGYDESKADSLVNLVEGWVRGIKKMRHLT